MQLTKSRYSNKLKKTFSSFHKGLNNFFEKNDLLKVFPVPGNFVIKCNMVLCGTQLGNYAVEIIQMTLELAWTYEIHHIQLKCGSIYRKEVKIIAITYFLAILATKIAITR